MGVPTHVAKKRRQNAALALSKNARSRGALGNAALGKKIARRAKNGNLLIQNQKTAINPSSSFWIKFNDRRMRRQARIFYWWSTNVIQKHNHPSSTLGRIRAVSRALAVSKSKLTGPYFPELPVESKGPVHPVKASWAVYRSYDLWPRSIFRR